MSIDTRTLRKWPDAVKAHINEMADVVASCCDQIDAQAAEIDHLKAQLDRHKAYCITHKGAIRYCNSSMRDAYSDEKVRADAAEAEIERLREALGRVARSFPTDTDMIAAGWEPLEIEEACNAFDAARAALQGESQ